MPRFPDCVAPWRLAWVLSAVLAGCATTPRAPLPPLDAQQQRSLLQDLAVFSFSGKAVVAMADQGATPSVEWRQQRDVARVKLTGPLGVGSMQLEYSPEHLRVVTSSGDKLADADAEQALESALGFVPPFDALRYWILGVPAPGAAAAVETHDAAGVLQQLEQQDWLIRYTRHVSVQTAAGSVQLPARLVATRDNLRLTLVVNRWRIK
jgi:outer membrane lipoprotein LolB